MKFVSFQSEKILYPRHLHLSSLHSIQFDLLPRSLVFIRVSVRSTIYLVMPWRDTIEHYDWFTTYDLVAASIGILVNLTT